MEPLAKPITRDDVLAALRNCYDPEIPVNIVDLGLVYDVAIDGGKIDVKMTLTAPACGMGPMIVADARSRIFMIPGVTAANVDMVFEPPWDPSRMSDEAKKTLGIV